MVKPKDLRLPFPKGARAIMLYENILYIPQRADPSSYVMPLWSDKNLFHNNFPVHVEFCSGNGEWIIDKALQNQEINWVAVEKRFDRVRKIWSKAKNHSISNLFIVFGDARFFAKELLSSNSITNLYINFPDPWPKNRHMKHRIISDELFCDVHRFLSPNGLFTFVTDDENYSSIFQEHAQRFRNDFLILNEDFSYESYGTSFFGSLFHAQGKKIHAHRVIRK